MQNFKTVACLCSRAGRFESYLVENPEDRFSRDEAQLNVAPECLYSIILSKKRTTKVLIRLRGCAG